jgi:hypothetical protein
MLVWGARTKLTCVNRVPESEVIKDVIRVHVAAIYTSGGPTSSET